MTGEQKKAIEAVQTVIDAAVKKGLFNDAKTVAAVHAAMTIIIEGLTK